jgi:cytidylate kinase
MFEFGQNQDNFLAEGRMTWYFIPDAFKIKLECNFGERIKRIANREQITIAKAKDETMVREQVVADRFKKAYGQASISKNSNFDLIIDSGAISAETVVDKIISCL